MAPDDEALFELVAFAVSSARGAPEEGAYTASLRLIEIAGRTAALAGCLTADKYLNALGERIRRGAAATYLVSPEQYLAFLDEILRDVAGEAVRRATDRGR